MCISSSRRRSLTLTPRGLAAATAAKQAAAAQAIPAAGGSGSGSPWAQRPLITTRPLPVPRPLAAAPYSGMATMGGGRSGGGGGAMAPIAPASMGPSPTTPSPSLPPQSYGGSAAALAAAAAAKKGQGGHHHRRNKHDLHVDHPYHDHSYDQPTDEKHITRGGVTEPFPLKLHRMLDKIESDGYASIISWQSHGRCFVVHRPREFVDIVMPKYFKQTKFASFQRQLNLYGFSRLTAGLDRGGYYHELFLRGKDFLAYRIHRMRVKGTRVRMASSPDREPNFYAMPPLCKGTGPCTVRGCCGLQSPYPMQTTAPPPPPSGPHPSHPGAPHMMAQPCHAQPYQPPPPQQRAGPPPMTSTRYGTPPPSSSPRAPPVASPPPASVPPQERRRPPERPYEYQAPTKQVYMTMVTPVNDRPSLSRDQMPSQSPAPEATAAAAAAAARRNEPQPMYSVPPPAPEAVARRNDPQPAYSDPPAASSPQQMGAIVEDDDDIDEVVFEGKVFHYLKPFKETSSLPPSPQRQAPKPETSYNDAPAIPESVPSFDASDAPPPPPRAASEPAASEQRRWPAVVPRSPAHTARSSAAATPQPQPMQTFARPLPPPPPLESMFETASRLAEIVYKRPPSAPAAPQVQVAPPEPPPPPATTIKADPEGKPDRAPSSAEDDREKHAAAVPGPGAGNLNLNINVHCQSDGVNVNVDVVRSSSAAAPVSDDEQQGISHSSSEADLSRDGAGESSPSSSGVNDNVPMSEDKISAEMESFFATLDSPAEMDAEMNAFLANDTNFGYMIERVLE